ncbi:hypothetical protein ACQRIU_003987 [Beauveria bassiana]
MMKPESTPKGSSSTPATAVEEKPWLSAWLRLQLAVKANITHNPTPGDILIIIDSTHPRVLACHPGSHLILDNIDEYDTSQPMPERWKWLCTENDGFLGFRSLAQDTFLGHDSWWNFVARSSAQKRYEHFVLVKYQDGYRIQSPSWFDFKVMSARRDGSGVEAGQPHGTLWGFMQVRE